MEPSGIHSTQPTNTTVSLNWDPVKLVTPGELIGIVSHGKVTLTTFDKLSGTLKQFFQNQNLSQGLFYYKNRVFAASVSTQITGNKEQKKPVTFAKAKSIFMTHLKDFSVKQINDRGTIYYQAGHLIDDKYSTGSNRDPQNYSNGCIDNYVPMVYFYNSPLKENLVHPHKELARQVQMIDYIEFPLYTSDPPLISDTSGRFHPIPIAHVLVQINMHSTSAKQIANVYCFPNHHFNYETLKSLKCVIQAQSFSAGIGPLFRIKKCFQQFLNPALIHEDEQTQIQRESESFELMKLISPNTHSGTSGHLIQNMFEKFIHHGEVDPSCFLEEEAFRLLKSSDHNLASLKIVFSTLARFMISYGIPNIVKAEVKDTKSRLVFLHNFLHVINTHTAFRNNQFKFSELRQLQRLLDNEEKSHEDKN